MTQKCKYTERKGVEMGYPIDNLGDYNIVRDDLKAVGGSIEKLYEKIGNIAVAKKAPKYFIAGMIVAIGLEESIKYGKKAVAFIKERKKLIEEEEIVKESFKESIKQENEV